MKASDLVALIQTLQSLSGDEHFEIEFMERGSSTRLRKLAEITDGETGSVPPIQRPDMLLAFSEDRFIIPLEP